MSEDARKRPIKIEWTGDGLIGRLTIGGEHWAAVEWSEKRQRWCVEDAEGKCLTHAASIKGMAESKEAAVALAKTMIHDGRMPDPKTARAEHEERRRVAREKRQQLPSENPQARREEKKQLSRWGDAATEEWKARTAEDKAPPLYETLAEAFDFADCELWKSNSFAALRPRLVLHVRHAVSIAKFEQELAYAAGRRKARRRLRWRSWQSRRSSPGRGIF